MAEQLTDGVEVYPTNRTLRRGKSRQIRSLYKFLILVAPPGLEPGLSALEERRRPLRHSFSGYFFVI
jgi:hypothetical protein